MPSSVVLNPQVVFPIEPLNSPALWILSPTRMSTRKKVSSLPCPWNSQVYLRHVLAAPQYLPCSRNWLSFHFLSPPSLLDFSQLRMALFLKFGYKREKQLINNLDIASHHNVASVLHRSAWCKAWEEMEEKWYPCNYRIIIINIIIILYNII